MRVPWTDPRCVVCLGTPEDGKPMTQRTEGHVIPKAIGGTLSASNVCKQCNSDMGTSEAVLGQDISVRLLVDQLEDRLPEAVVHSIRYRQSYFTDHDDYGRVEAGMDKSAHDTEWWATKLR